MLHNISNLCKLYGQIWPAGQSLRTACITESWANIDITYAELRLTEYVLFRKDRIGRRGGGVILYVKESNQACEIKLEREADCDEAVWC